MGSLKLTLSVLVLACYVAQALKCNICLYNSACGDPRECTSVEDKCIKIVMNDTIIIRRCAKSNECPQEKKLEGLVTKTCCDTDFCN
ncbi:hypothetical protein ANANG_G00044740 [Anguilla anguilla]|uniref:Snake toxin/toxin-like domain-containing protein n=1 Tax=Anguilla anguilla TaxID=7936 RepID=A0A9D3S4Y4_ANGAN|nr:hypothetical protein ANANG_G00044740 [Anguilla anguilla]